MIRAVLLSLGITVAFPYHVFSQKKDSCSVAANWSLEADTLFGSGSYDKALKMYDRALHLCPKLNYIRLNKGDLLIQMERYDEALKAYLSYKNLFPKDYLVYRKLAGWHYYTGDIDSSLYYLSEAVRYNEKDTLSLFTHGELLVEQGQYEPAKNYFQQVLKLHPDHFNAIIYMADLCLEHEEWDECARWLKEAERVQPLHNDFLVSKAAFLHATGQTADAILLLDKAEIKESYDGIVLERKAEYLMRSEKFEEARKAIELAKKTDPSSTSAFYLSGKLYNLTGNYAAATEDFSLCLMLDSAYHPAWFELGNASYGIMDYEKAIGYYSVYLDFVHNDESASFNRGTCFYSLGKYENAIEDFTDALAIDPFPDYYFNRSLCYFALKQYEKAEADMSVYINGNKSDKDAFYYRSLMHHYLQKKNEACEDAVKAIELGQKEFPKELAKKCKLKKYLHGK
ncbi:MAG: tetratricopeptide repeat protein [Bacteroidota bacterium]